MVVFLYLLDEKTSLLVQVPAGIAAVIEVSSCYGAVNVGRIFSFPGFHHWSVTVFVYCKQSKTGVVEGIGTRLCVYVWCFLDFTQFWKLGKAYKIKLKWSGVLPWIEVSFTMLLILE